MKAAAAVCACLAGSATAFTGPFVGSAVQQRVVVARGMSMQEAAAPPAPVMSKSVPFVIKPGKLDGLIGNAEFDPLYFSEFFPVKYLQESEIKHGRVAMLAVVGFIVSEIVHLPGAAYSAANPVDAPTLVGGQPLAQIFLFCGLLETIFHKGKLTVEDMHNNGEEPGSFGFDPLGVSKDPSKLARSRLSEIKNGRLAMLAIGGLIFQSIVTGHGVPLN